MIFWKLSSLRQRPVVQSSIVRVRLHSVVGGCSQIRAFHWSGRSSLDGVITPRQFNNAEHETTHHFSQFRIKNHEIYLRENLRKSRRYEYYGRIGKCYEKILAIPLEKKITIKLREKLWFPKSNIQFNLYRCSLSMVDILTVI